MRCLNSNFDLAQFWLRVRSGAQRALLLDYDGTLAPFRSERDEAFPYPDVRLLLETILNAGHTRVVIISGRAVDDLLPLLQLDAPPEIWGNHGWERRLPDGTYVAPQLAPAVAAGLQEARDWIVSQGLERESERKPASVTVHWRAADEAERARRANAARVAWEPLVANAALELHAFDGGLELRATGRNKGTAVAELLQELEPSSAVAFAGDDRTDEDAFEALGVRGLRVLVRAERRATAADVWLRPPAELVEFLQTWHQCAMESQRTPAHE